MMPTDRFERQLPELLTELANPRTPDYLDDLLWQTANTSQRPAWSFLERWIPMVDFVRQPIFAPRIPWRSIGLGLALLGLLLAAVAIALVGSRQPLPEPFGLARNGTLAYAADGDIFAVDPATGVSTAIVSGPETDSGPVFSRDGTHLVFARNVGGASGARHLYVIKADGSELTIVTPEPPILNGPYQFSPDGREVIFTSIVGSTSTIHIARSDGSGVRTLDVEFSAFGPDYRAPDGAEIVFRGTHGSDVTGLYAIRPDSTGFRTIVEPTNMVFDYVRWSPDGSEVAYTAWGGGPDGPDHGARVHVTSADGLTTRILPALPALEHEAVPVWSNDGTRLLVWRCVIPPDTEECLSRLAVVPADGRDAGVQLETDVLLDDDHPRWTLLWAPDDESVLASMADPTGTTFAGLVRWEPLTGQTTPVTWTPEGPPSWQRLGP